MIFFTQDAANGNVCEVARLYQNAFPNRRQPNDPIFPAVYDYFVTAGYHEI